MHDKTIKNQHTFLNKEHNNIELDLAKDKFPNVEKWLFNEQINHKLSKFFWKTPAYPMDKLSKPLHYDVHNTHETT